MACGADQSGVGAQRLGLTVATEQGRLLSGATVQRILAAISRLLRMGDRGWGRMNPDDVS